MADPKTSFTDDPKMWIGPSIILSGLCWYLANGIHGESWFLMWIAPVPLLVLCFNHTAPKAFLYAFLAYLIGRMSWFPYLLKVATLVPAVIFTLLFPLIFGGIILLTRKVVLRNKFGTAIFAFPVFFTAFEFLLVRFSTDGTAASIAYTQSDFLPLIQVSSLTGILGVTFLLTFIPSIIAVGWYKKTEIKFRCSLILATGVLLAACIFGMTMASGKRYQRSIKAGLVVLDENMHHITSKADSTDETGTVSAYAREIASLADSGAKLVVLPERAFDVYSPHDTVLMILSRCASASHIWIIAGYTDFKDSVQHNSSMVINPEGKIVCDYNKVHLVKGFETQFVPGNRTGLFSMDRNQFGTAICKDLDFQQHIRKYGLSDVEVMCVPAWDFVVDDWLHSRMAVLRGVENGFSMVRTARLGLLTITNPFGKVLSSASSAKGKKAILIGNVPLGHLITPYSRYGDWFGFLVLIGAVVLIVFTHHTKPGQ
jgi:apolipoprotein N-acyltransferase